MPSDYIDLIFSTCWYDVVFKIKLKTTELSTNHLQFYNSMAEIVSAVFGDDKKKKDQGAIKVNDMNPDQAVNTLNDFFKRAGGG